jgi:DNA-binding SARP family transcriptional activator/ABC-type transport system substrate-binding protein
MRVVADETLLFAGSVDDVISAIAATRQVLRRSLRRPCSAGIAPTLRAPPHCRLSKRSRRPLGMVLASSAGAERKDLDFRLLGPLEALSDGRPVALGGAKQRGLLALLLLYANEVVPRDRLIDELWRERPPGTAEHSLDVQISRLRKAFEPEELIMTRSGGYVLQIDPEQIDVHRFERLLEQGRAANAAGSHSEALHAFEEAEALWRGAPLADLAYESFARPEIDRLDELRLVTKEERIEAQLALGRHTGAVSELEKLVQEHPLRERLRRQLMLALYRSGRQADALRVYSETRSALVRELGIEPGSALRELEQAILRQDPALHPPRAAVETRRRRALVGAAALLLAGGAVAAIVRLTHGATESAHALAEADSNVVLSSKTGEVVSEASVRETLWVRFDGDSLWSVSANGELTRLDPATGETIATIGLGVEPAGLAVGEGSVWVTGRHSPTLFRIDPSVNEIVDRFLLPMDGVVTDLTGEVVVGAGSVWVGHGGFNPGAWVERLDPQTGRAQKRFSILAGDVDHLAFGEGALWVASTPSGELRKIDPRTNKIVFRRNLQAELCCVASGGGYVWAATNPNGDVWKVARNGSLLPTIKLSSAIERLTYADGALWATLGGKGTVVRIDPTTDAVRPYSVGHSVTAVDAQDGRVAIGVRESAEDATAGLKGDVIWVGRKASTLFDSGAATDPAFTGPTWDSPQLQFHFATCARLLNYADVEGDAGRKLVPEVAEDFPKVSDGGRTYTFMIRKGFRFSPPSNEDVTAESFRHAIERVLSPKFDYVAPQLQNIVGAVDYHAGIARHISGITARDDTLVIRFNTPEPDLPWLAAMSCAVPAGTPVVPNGIETPVASAGPYYLAEHTDAFAVLKRNPNYGGSRPQHLDAIVFEFSVAPGDAAEQIENAKLDYFLDSQNPTLTARTAAAREAGDRWRLTPDGTAGTTFFAFNWNRPLFADLRSRRAVQYALDRRALAEADPGGGSPATRLLHPKLPAFAATPLYPVRGDLRTARKLAGGRRAPVVVFTWRDPPYTDAFNGALREQLGAIGLRMTVLPIAQGESQAAWLAKASRADLIWGGLNAETADAAAYLQRLYLPTEEQRNELQRLMTLSSPERERASVALARKIERASLFAVYRNSAVPELVSRRLGCVVHQPEYPGVDLAALCLRG